MGFFTVKLIHWIESMIQMERSDPGLRQSLKTDMAVIYISRQRVNTVENIGSVIKKK